MLQSLALLYAEHALARKIKYGQIFSDFAEKSHRRSRTMYSRGVKLVSVQGPLQANLISSGPNQCNHCLTPLL